MYWLLIPYLTLFFVLCRAYRKMEGNKSLPWIKFSLSVLFILIAAVSGLTSGRTFLFWITLPGFSLAAFGDLLLGFARARGNVRGWEFLAGTGAFLLAHIAFYAAFSTFLSPSFLELGLAFSVSILVFFLMRDRRLSVGKMAVPGIIYAFFVGLFLSKSLALFFVLGPTLAHGMLLTGASLFLFSDLLLIYINFLPNGRRLIFVNLGTYYAAMALLAFSLSYFPR